MATKTITFPKFPTWNFHFPEPDVAEIKAVRFFAKGQADPLRQEYPIDKVRLATGRNGVSAIVFKEKHALPATAEQNDAVEIEYEV